jgi:fibronectin-binding autotransporter adhesin
MLKTVSTQLALASDTLPEVLAKGNTTGGTDLAVSAGDDITLADNSKVIFGAGSDLSIYSDGATGQVTGSVNVTGTATVSGDLTVGSATSQNGVFGVVLGSGGNDEGVVVVSGATGTGWLGFNNGNNASIPGQVTYNHSTNLLSFYSSGTISLTGAATFSDNIIIGTSGKGIDFSATAGTGTSELLDDYEEGTFTVDFTMGSGSVTTSTSNNTASYTKIGRYVFVTGNIEINAASTPSGAMSFQLPFTISNTTQNSERFAGTCLINGFTTGNGAGMITADSGTSAFVKDYTNVNPTPDASCEVYFGFGFITA